MFDLFRLLRVRENASADPAERTLPMAGPDASTYSYSVIYVRRHQDDGFQPAFPRENKLVSKPLFLKFLSYVAICGGVIIACSAHAAELVMFEQAGCVWCETFDREIAPTYGKTAEGLRAPLRRVNVDRIIPPDLAFIPVERLTPLFVLVNNGREIGRIRGYPGEDHFWGLLGVLIKKLDDAGERSEPTQFFEKSLHAVERLPVL